MRPGIVDNFKWLHMTAGERSRDISMPIVTESREVSLGRVSFILLGEFSFARLGPTITAMMIVGSGVDVSSGCASALYTNTMLELFLFDYLMGLDPKSTTQLIGFFDPFCGFGGLLKHVLGRWRPFGSCLYWASGSKPRAKTS